MSDAPAGLILAAGAGRRFGGAKQLLRVHGRTLLEWSILRLRRAGVTSVVVAAASRSDGTPQTVRMSFSLCCKVVLICPM